MMFKLLESMGIDTAGFDRWDVAWKGLEGYSGWVLVAAAALVLIFWSRGSVRELSSRPRRYFLLCWQALTMALVIIVVLQPALRLARTARIKERVAVLMDTSESMSLPADKSGESRESRAFGFIDRNRGFFEDLEREFNVSYYGFDSSLSELQKRPDREMPAVGDETDIVGAVSAAAGGGSGLSGVVLVSDGADTTGRGARLKGDTGAAEARALLAEFPAPVNTVLCGGGAEVRDLAMVEVRHDDYGFVHNPFEVAVSVKSEGGLATQAPVIFKQGGQVLASRTISIDPATGRGEAVLSFTPRQVGEYMFSVEIPEASGEVTARNNLVLFPLKILRDKIRILYIVGNPSWDERFLRLCLKKNPSVDLVSFYILREHWDDYMARQDEVSLIPFPTDALFTEELDSFDLVIWQNFRGPLYMPGTYSRYMSELNRYVRERGGALLMIGGHRAFLGGNRLDPKLVDLLPVELSDAVPNYVEEQFKTEVTEAGLRHPIMMIEEDEGELAETWSGLPALDGFNRVKRAAPGALVLAVNPLEKGEDGPLPLIVVRETGAGRVMAIMTDYSWYWNFLAVGEGGSSKPYQRFYENSLRWLLRDPAMRLVSVTTDKGSVKPGDEVTVMIEVLDETYSPTDHAEVSVEVLDQPAPDELVLPEPEHYGKGKYRLVLKPQARGGYRLRAAATLEGRPLGHDEVVFEASEKSAEWLDVMPAPKTLALISKVSGGISIPASGNPRDFAFKRAEVRQVVGSKDVPLWDNWLAFTVIFLMMVTGWFLRRKWGLR